MTSVFMNQTFCLNLIGSRGYMFRIYFYFDLVTKQTLKCIVVVRVLRVSVFVVFVLFVDWATCVFIGQALQLQRFCYFASFVFAVTQFIIINFIICHQCFSWNFQCCVKYKKKENTRRNTERMRKMCQCSARSNLRNIVNHGMRYEIYENQ